MFSFILDVVKWKFCRISRWKFLIVCWNIGLKLGVGGSGMGGGGGVWVRVVDVG